MPTYASGCVKYHVSDFLCDRHPYTAHASKVNVDHTGEPSHTVQGIAKRSFGKKGIENLLEILSADKEKLNNPVEISRALLLLLAYAAADEGKVYLLRHGTVRVVAGVLIRAVQCSKSIVHVTNELVSPIQGPSGNIVADTYVGNIKNDPIIYSWALVEQKCCQLFRALATMTDGAAAVVTQGGWRALLCSFCCEDGCGLAFDSEDGQCRDLARIAAVTAIEMIASRITGIAHLSGRSNHIACDLETDVVLSEFTIEESESSEDMLLRFFLVSFRVLDYYRMNFLEPSVSEKSSQKGTALLSEEQKQLARQRSNQLSLVISVTNAIRTCVGDLSVLSIAIQAGLIATVDAFLPLLVKLCSAASASQEVGDAVQDYKQEECAVVSDIHNFPGTTPVGFPAAPPVRTAIDPPGVAKTSVTPQKGFILSDRADSEHYITVRKIPLVTSGHVFDMNAYKGTNSGYTQLKKQVDADERKYIELASAFCAILWSAALCEDGRRAILHDFAEGGTFVPALAPLLQCALESLQPKLVEGKGFPCLVRDSTPTGRRVVLELQCNVTGAIAGFELLPEIKKMSLDPIPFPQCGDISLVLSSTSCSHVERVEKEASKNRENIIKCYYPAVNIVQLLVQQLRQTNYFIEDAQGRLGDKQLKGLAMSVASNTIQALRLVAEWPEARKHLHAIFKTEKWGDESNAPNIIQSHHCIRINEKGEPCKQNDLTKEVAERGTEHELRCQIFYTTPWEKEFMIYVF